MKNCLRNHRWLCLRWVDDEACCTAPRGDMLAGNFLVEPFLSPDFPEQIIVFSAATTGTVR